MSVHAPYNFVPLSRFIYLPHWANEVSHDVPFSDGISGALQLELSCETPTLVGGQQAPASQHAPRRVEFFKGPDGRPMIPGSSLKGMISNVLEIASFARFDRVADKRYGVRDLTESNNFYLSQFSGRGSRSGWLRFDETTGRWQITFCQMARIHQQKIVDEFDDVDLKSWVDKRGKTAPGRYSLLNGLRTLRFDTETHKNKGTIGVPSPDGKHEGTLVVTGQPGQCFNAEENKRAKKWEFLFYNRANTATLVPEAVFRDFLFIHQDSDEWGYWVGQKAAFGAQGIPVFYLAGNAGKVRALGLSYLFRLAYKNSIHEAIANTNPAHLDDSHSDLPELLFGKIGSEAGESVKGRVSIGAARLMGTPVYKEMEDTILNGPKPTYYPSYIRQPGADTSGELKPGQKYQTLMDKKAQLNGWKRYPVRNDAEVEPLTRDNRDNNKVQVQLLPVAVGSRFGFSIRFHNLRPAELGALLWSLDFGEQKFMCHGLGMGKPFGMGRVQLRIAGQSLQSNDGADFAEEELLSLCRQSFTGLMSAAYGKATRGAVWQESPQLTELLAMADPYNSGDHLQYMKLEKGAGNNAFVTAKGNVSRPGYALPPHSNKPMTEPEIFATKAPSVAPIVLPALAELKAHIERENARQAMSETQLNIDDLSQLIDKLSEDATSKSTRQGLNKQMQQLAKEAADWSEEDKAACQTELERLEALDLLPDKKQFLKLQKKL